jgi:hypothetical protein
LHREVRAFSEGDLRAEPCGDCQSDFPADSYRDSQADLRRGLRTDLQEDFHGEFDSDLRFEVSGADLGSSDQFAVCRLQSSARSQAPMTMSALGGVTSYQ